MMSAAVEVVAVDGATESVRSSCVGAVFAAMLTTQVAVVQPSAVLPSFQT